MEGKDFPCTHPAYAGQCLYQHCCFYHAFDEDHTPSAPPLVLCSPVEAYQAFQAHRVCEAQFTEQGPLLVSKPSLMCRLGDRILPWTQAAPVVLGVLAFGGDWQTLLLPDQGVPVTVPLQQAQGGPRDPSKVSCCGSGLSQDWLQACVLVIGSREGLWRCH